MSQTWNYLQPTAPTGFSQSDIKACYQFDGPTLGLTDRTANGHDLIDVSPTTGLAWVAMQAALGCNGRFHAWDANFMYTAEDVALMTLGACTGELVWMPCGSGSLAQPTNGMLTITSYPADVGSVGNTTFSFGRTDQRNLAERGMLFIGYDSGLGVWTEVFSPNGVCPGIHGQMTYTAITRAADGKTYKIYHDGVHVDTIAAPAAPDGGTDSALIIGAIDTTANEYGRGVIWQSVRWSHGEMTEGQIDETYLQLRTA